MRAPFQILAIPYKIIDGTLMSCVMHRSDIDQWQFIAGGGEDSETPYDAAKREISEESGIFTDNILKLTAMAYVPAKCIAERNRKLWPTDTYVIPEYCFAFECYGDIALSHEHTGYAWLTYDEACKKLKWDSNRTALYELKCILDNNVTSNSIYALVFIDGTICDDRHRLHLFGTNDFSAPENILKDKPVSGSLEFLQTLSNKYNLIYIGARSPELTDITRQWLASCGFPDGELYLAAAQEERLNLVKKILRNKNIAIGIGDRWDDNQLHLEIGCKSIIVKEYNANWDFVKKHISGGKK